MSVSLHPTLSQDLVCIVPPSSGSPPVSPIWLRKDMLLRGPYPDTAAWYVTGPGPPDSQRWLLATASYLGEGGHGSRRLWNHFPPSPVWFQTMGYSCQRRAMPALRSGLCLWSGGGVWECPRLGAGLGSVPPGSAPVVHNGVRNGARLQGPDLFWGPGHLASEGLPPGAGAL